MAVSQIQKSASKFEMESAVHTSQGKTRMVFFAQFFFQVGVLWSSAIFGVWTLCRPVARFYFPAVQWVPASIAGFGDSRHPCEGEKSHSCWDWGPGGRSSLTQWALDWISMPRLQCHVFWLWNFNVAKTRNFIPFDSDKVCMGWTWYLGSLAATQTKSHSIGWDVWSFKLTFANVRLTRRWHDFLCARKRCLENI